MKKLLFLLLFIPFLGTSQGTFTAPVGYNTGAPTAAPSGVGTRWRFDLLTGKKYTWNPDAVAWDEDARGIDQVSGCSAPLYTPGYNQSTFAVNSCTPKPELYQWTGSAWALLNPETLYTEGTGIDITGGVITNTSPNVVQTLSIAGQDLTLSGGGGTVEIPAGSSLGTGFTAGGGSGTIPDGTVAELLGTFNFLIPASTNYTFGRKDVDGIEGFAGYVIDNSNYSGLGFDSRDGRAYFEQSLVSTDGNYRTLFHQDGIQMSFQSIDILNTASAQFSAGSGLFAFSALDNIGNQVSLNISPTYANFIDERPVKKGIEYLFEYPDILTNDRSIPDVGLTKTLIASEGWSWPLLAPDGSAAAPSYSFSNSAETGIFYNNALLVASAPQGAVNARNIEIKSGSGTSGNGGAVLINAGNSSGRGGGQVSVTAGNSSGRNGGQINFRAGDTDTQTGGAVTLQSGNGATGGNYNMIAGSGTSGNGGTFYFIGGNSASALGGNIEFVAGNGVDQSKNGDIIFAGNQAVLPLLTISQRDNISVKKIGGTIYCSDCTATDSSTGVQQVYNGSTWKNAW